jgi:hypothetical protein
MVAGLHYKEIKYSVRVEVSSLNVSTSKTLLFNSYQKLQVATVLMREVYRHR